MKGWQLPGIESRALGLNQQCSTTELQQLDNHQPSEFFIFTECLSSTSGSHLACATLSSQIQVLFMVFLRPGPIWVQEEPSIIPSGYKTTKTGHAYTCVILSREPGLSLYWALLVPVNTIPRVYDYIIMN